ncbi:MAG: C25 family cysteine peptidase [Bacteroidales bacterium]|jgi:hypothetical protein
MKKSISVISKITILTVFLMSGFSASSTSVVKHLIPGMSNTFSVTINSFDKIQTYSTLNELNVSYLNVGNGHFVEISAPEYTKTNIVGNPQLPVISKLIEIPTGGRPIVTVKSYEVQEYKLSDLGINDMLLPVQPPQPKSGDPVPFTINMDVYSNNSFYSEELARVEVNGYLRSTQLANLIISPVQYNPVTNTIRVINNIIVDVDFEGADYQATQELKLKTRSPYFDNFSYRTLNPISIASTRDTLSKVPVKYVIVSDPMFKDQLVPFVNWKTKKGFKVIEAYTDDPEVGNTFNSIKNFLKGLYQSATVNDPAPTFVLFVGDVAQIPAYNCGQHYSDLYYCEYSNDYMPEVYYGRFSANNPDELQPQIDKTLMHEQYLMPDPSYLNEVVMIAGNDASHSQKWGNGQINYGTTYYFNEEHGILSHTYLQPEPSGANYSQSIRDNVSNGVCYVNYTAHGNIDGWDNPSFKISHIPSLQNYGKYPLMVGNCCLTNVYNQHTFGEALLRAEDKGALGYIGASNSTYWDEDYWWGVGFGTVSANATYEATGLGAYDRTFHDHGEPRSEWYATMEQMTFAGLLAVQESNSTMKKYYWEVYCLMGDPSVMMYFSEPPAMSYSALPLLPLGHQSFEIQTEPYAYVAITRNNVIYGVAEADESGLAVVNLNPITIPGYVNVVMTKQNFQPYIDSVMVASPEGAYLFLSNYQFTDTAGNNNQILEYDELISVNLTYNNYGSQSAVNAVSTLTTNNPYVEILTPSYTWSNIPSNGAATAYSAFDIKLRDGIPDMTQLVFNLVTTFDTSTFETQLYGTVQAPTVTNLDFIFDDATYGNGNGQFDPGETIIIKQPVANQGHCPTGEVTSQLFIYDNDLITVNEGITILPALNPSDIDTATFSITLDNSVQVGSNFTLYITSYSGMYSDITTVIPQIGSQFEDFETGNFSKFNWEMADVPFVISNQNPHAGSYSAKSGTIGNNGKSTMYIQGNVLQNDQISFYVKTGTQAGFDFLNFYIDSVLVKSWSGVTPWQYYTCNVSSGNHTFRWSYEKNENTLVQPDAVWVDDIKFPPMGQSSGSALSVNVLASPDSTCAGNSTQLYAFASGGVTQYMYEWSPAESLSNPNVFNPIASPLETTTYTVIVRSGLENVTKTLSVTVTPGPDAPIIHEQGDDLVSSYATGNQWYNLDGIIPGATQQTYTPTNTNSYYCVYTDENDCVSEASNVITVLFQGVDKTFENKISVYPNPLNNILHIDFSLKNNEDISIMLYNAIGTKVKQVNIKDKYAGNHAVDVDVSDLASGIYMCKVIFGNNYSKTIKIIKR